MFAGGTVGTGMPAPRHTPAELLRQRLIGALEACGGSMTTAQLRDHIQSSFPGSVVIEAVYRNLTVLERRGDVQRESQQGRNAYWRLASASSRSGRSLPA